MGNLCKIIVAASFEWLPKVQKIANLVTLIVAFTCSIVLSFFLSFFLSRKDERNNPIHWARKTIIGGSYVSRIAITPSLTDGLRDRWCKTFCHVLCVCVSIHRYLWTSLYSMHSTLVEVHIYSVLDKQISSSHHLFLLFALSFINSVFGC